MGGVVGNEIFLLILWWWITSGSQAVFDEARISMYPFTNLDFSEKPGRHPEGRLSQQLTGLGDASYSQYIFSMILCAKQRSPCFLPSE
jgi:hypothetical protein